MKGLARLVSIQPYDEGQEYYWLQDLHKGLRSCIGQEKRFNPTLGLRTATE